MEHRIQVVLLIFKSFTARYGPKIDTWGFAFSILTIWKWIKNKNYFLILVLFKHHVVLHNQWFAKKNKPHLTGR